MFAITYHFYDSFQRAVEVVHLFILVLCRVMEAIGVGVVCCQICCCVVALFDDHLFSSVLFIFLKSILE